MWGESPSASDPAFLEVLRLNDEGQHRRAKRTRYIWLCHLWGGGHAVGVGVMGGLWWLAAFGLAVTIMAAWWIRQMNSTVEHRADE